MLRTQKCVRCGKQKPLVLFDLKARNKRTGRAGECKSCRAVRQAKEPARRAMKNPAWWG